MISHTVRLKRRFFKLVRNVMSKIIINRQKICTNVKLYFWSEMGEHLWGKNDFTNNKYFVTLCAYKNYSPSIGQDKFQFIQHFQGVFLFIL